MSQLEDWVQRRKTAATGKPRLRDILAGRSDGVTMQELCQTYGCSVKNLVPRLVEHWWDGKIESFRDDNHVVRWRLVPSQMTIRCHM